jgi:hypothetical protein
MLIMRMKLIMAKVMVSPDGMDDLGIVIVE